MSPRPDVAPAPPQEPYVVPDSGCAVRECVGPEPVPWLPWKHCFRTYELRYVVLPLGSKEPPKATGRKLPPAAQQVARAIVRVRYEHALCLLGRKQGPVVHSLTLLPKEVVRVYEYDRYKRSTAEMDRFSVRSSFFTQLQRVQDAYSSTRADAGGSVSTASAVGGSGGGGIDLGIISFGGSASASSSIDTGAYFDVATVSEHFSHVAETTSHAVESERSIVVSTFEEKENVHSTARTLRNDNDCRAVTYYLRRVLEVYQLATRIVAVEVQLGGRWVPLKAARGLPDGVTLESLRIDLAATHESRTELVIPTDGLVYEAELAHCCSCDSDREARIRLELEKLQLENLLLRLEATRRQKRLDGDELGPFEPAAAPAPAPTASPAAP